MDLSKFFGVGPDSNLYLHNERLRRIEGKVEQLLEFFEIKLPDDNGLPSEIQNRLVANQRIEAIKLYRERFGVGLSEAKDAIETGGGKPILYHIEDKLDLVLKELGIQKSVNVPDQDERTLLSDAVKVAILRGNKIKAIKLYREEHDVGLKEAKDIIEEMERRIRDR